MEASHLKASESFVTSVQQDKDAVLAGLTLPWSTGPVEGQVNRLKLIKREPGMAAPSSIYFGYECCTTPKRKRCPKTQRRELFTNDGKGAPKS